ncbi:MAG: lecithin retinol acyltransferase family protein [Eubacteriales bacterium]
MNFFNDFIPDPFQKRNRKLEELYEDVRRDFQEITEDICGELDSDLGELSKEWHELQNMVHDLGRNVVDTVDNNQSALDLLRYIEVSLNSGYKLQEADHLFVYRPGFTHHGLYIGNNEVIHYEKGSVHRDSFENFQKGMKIYALPEKESPLRYTTSQVLERAKSRLGENDYNLIVNNCEHFVRWCRAGREP